MTNRLCATHWGAYGPRVDTPQPSVVLKDQICFALYRASRAVTARYRPMLERMGITYPQLLALMVLWEEDGLTVREMSDRLDLDSGTMTPMLKRLAALDLVTRERDPEDERLVRIRLTEAGRALEQPACGVSEMMIGALALDMSQFSALKGQLETLTAQVGTYNTVN